MLVLIMLWRLLADHKSQMGYEPRLARDVEHWLGVFFPLLSLFIGFCLVGALIVYGVRLLEFF